MKDTESDYLNRLFTRSFDETGEADTDFPLVDVPEQLTEKLHAITASTQHSAAADKPRMFRSWPKMTSIAASLLVAVVVFQLYQQQQTLKQLEQAQSDLATALHYLDEANKITRAQVLNSLNTNMRKAAVAPAIEVGRDAVLPGLKPVEQQSRTSSRTL